jgi:class 3 adenylate cyclase
VEVPETKYAASTVGKIAYQLFGEGPVLFGEGPVNVLVQPRSWLPIDVMWEEPRMVRFLDRLSSFCRQVWFDPRGRGMSDPLPPHSRVAEIVVEDMLAVLDFLGWADATIIGLSGTHEVLIAATHPERVKALVLVEPAVRFRRSADYPEGWDDRTVETWLGSIEQNWGTGANLELYAPKDAGDSLLARWFGRCERAAMSPAEARLRYRAAWEIDLRHVLPTVNVPTLVVEGDERSRTWSRYISEHIPNCRQIPGADPGHLFFTGDTQAMLDGIEEFITGRLPVRDLDRVLATVLFTDLVASTHDSARLGDRRWIEVLADHNAVVRRELERFRGIEVKTTGDGFVATFDGPARAVRAAQSIVHAVRSLGLEVRTGLHTGEIQRLDDDVAGITVHIAQRIAALAPPGGILVSATVKDLVGGSGISFQDEGSHVLKGVPEAWHLFSVHS